MKDPTSDMAQFAKKGSQLVRHLREQREKQKAVKAQFVDVKAVRIAEPRHAHLTLNLTVLHLTLHISLFTSHPAHLAFTPHPPHLTVHTSPSTPRHLHLTLHTSPFTPHPSHLAIHT